MALHVLGLPHTLEGRRARHSHSEGSQGRVREAAIEGKSLPEWVLLEGLSHAGPISVILFLRIHPVAQEKAHPRPAFPAPSTQLRSPSPRSSRER